MMKRTQRSSSPAAWNVSKQGQNEVTPSLSCYGGRQRRRKTQVISKQETRGDLQSTNCIFVSVMVYVTLQHIRDYAND
jgi:hypothetical protein